MRVMENLSISLPFIWQLNDTGISFVRRDLLESLTLIASDMRTLRMCLKFIGIMVSARKKLRLLLQWI